MPKKRKADKKQLKSRLYIFCEGEKTEPNYLNGYIETYFPGTKLSVLKKTNKNTPIQLVEAAIAEQKENPKEDQFWVVYDREAENKYTDQQHAEALNKAKSKGIHIAFSNVCFEVWILLHFQSNIASYNHCSDLLKKSNLKIHIKNYDKGEKRAFSKNEICNARKNAKALNHQTKSGANRQWTKPYQWNPYTDVYKLLDAIDVLEK